MNIWIVTVGEPLPIDAGSERLLRAGLLGPVLIDRGHMVTWWTSTFNHVLKRQRFSDDEFVKLGSSYAMRLLHGRGYRENVSLSRLFDHWQVARKFRRQSHELEPRPDVILCSFPTIELSVEAVRYGRKHGIPVVLDLRDMWPDIFLPLAPAALRPFAITALWPYFRAARWALKNATALFGITEEFLEWGLEHARRTRNKYDRAFPMGYPSTEPTPAEQERAREFWRDRKVNNNKEDGTFKVMFAGTIGRQFEFEPVVEVAKVLGPEFRFIICGTGDRFAQLQSLCQSLPNVVLPGWVGAAEIWTLMRMAHVGLAPYHDEESFTRSLPNKALEYLSAGLPIVSSLPGALARLLAECRCGITYSNRDAAALLAALKGVHGDPQTLGKMATNALTLFNARFRAEAVYAEMAESLEAIAARTPAGRSS